MKHILPLAALLVVAAPPALVGATGAGATAKCGASA